MEGAVWRCVYTCMCACVECRFKTTCGDCPLRPALLVPSQACPLSTHLHSLGQVPQPFLLVVRQELQPGSGEGVGGGHSGSRVQPGPVGGCVWGQQHHSGSRVMGREITKGVQGAGSTVASGSDQ